MTTPPAASKTDLDLAWINGEMGPLREARIPLLDRGVVFGEAVYEVCAGRGGRIFAPDEHMRRLERSLAGIMIPGVPDVIRRVDAACRDLVAAFGRGTFLLYIHVSGGVAPRLHVLPRDPEPAVYATIRPHDRGIVSRDQERGLSAITAPDLRWPRATWKTTQLLANVMAKKAARAAGVDDVVFVGADGVVLEGASTNVFWVTGGRVCTAPLARNILPGVSRELLMTRLGIAFDEVEADVGTLRAAQEVFMTGTTRDVTGVVTLDGVTIGDGRPGPVTRDLARRFAELFERECPAAT